MEPYLITMEDLPSQVRQKLDCRIYLLLMICVMVFCKRVMHPDSVTGLSIYYTDILRVFFKEQNNKYCWREFLEGDSILARQVFYMRVDDAKYSNFLCRCQKAVDDVETTGFLFE